MNLKKNWPGIVLALVFFIAIMVYTGTGGAEIIPTLLGFALGGACVYFIYKKLPKK
jgi:hypothetical protein